MALEQDKTNQTIPVNFNIPTLYTNAVTVGFSPTDLQLTATINGRPSALISMPFSTAKTLLNNIHRALTEYERRTGTKILDLAELHEKLKDK
jgi:hypothetical protein